MMTEHTPGPYIVDEMSDAFTIREERTNRELALIIRRGTTEHLWAEEEATAGLFAAAPDLLAACKKQQEFADHFVNCSTCGTDRAIGIACAEGLLLLADASGLRQSAIAAVTNV